MGVNLSDSVIARASGIRCWSRSHLHSTSRERPCTQALHQGGRRPTLDTMSFWLFRKSSSANVRWSCVAGKVLPEGEQKRSKDNTEVSESPMHEPQLSFPCMHAYIRSLLVPRVINTSSRGERSPTSFTIMRRIAPRVSFLRIKSLNCHAI